MPEVLNFPEKKAKKLKKKASQKPARTTEPPGTPEEQAFARVLMWKAHNCAGTFMEKYTAAVRLLDPQTYKHLSNTPYTRYSEIPEGSRQYISWRGGKNSHKNFNQASDVPLPSASPAPNPLLLQWWEDVRNYKSMKYALHPEDESDIIDFLHADMA